MQDGHDYRTTELSNLITRGSTTRTDGNLQRNQQEEEIRQVEAHIGQIRVNTELSEEDQRPGVLNYFLNLEEEEGTRNNDPHPKYQP